VHPCSITEQTRLVLENLRSILDHEGLVWTDVVKVTKYLTDMRDLNAISAELRKVFADWTPASTTVCVNQLSTPGARLEIEMVVAYPGR
jgi:2-aminomuconate deaminase